MKVLVGVNVLTSIASEVYGNHCQFWYRLGKEHPEHEFIFYHPRRVSIDNMRNEAAKQALLHECDYLMFIDDDVLLSKGTFESLISANKDIVMALTYIRVYPYKPMFFKEVARQGRNLVIDHWEGFEESVPENGILDCPAVGFACVLIKCDLIKKVSVPYFLTSHWHTEDVYFCIKAQDELGYENVSIAVDTRVPTGHILDSEVITVKTRKALNEYYESLNGKPEKDTGDRKLEYIYESLNKLEEKYAKA